MNGVGRRTTDETLSGRALKPSTTIRAQLRQLHDASFTWARACCGYRDDIAEDVLQTAYLKIIDGRASYDARRARGSFRTWWFAVIANTAKDAARAEFRRARNIAVPSNEAVASLPPAAGPTRTRIARALAALSDNQRRVVELVLMHEFTLAEAAQTLGMRLGTASTHYRRGKAALRAALEDLRDAS